MDLDVRYQTKVNVFEKPPEIRPARILWVDVAKGMAIFFVMMGHTRVPLFSAWYIYSFHVPFFFFLSGYLFSLEKNPSFVGFLKKRSRLLLLPYLVFSLLSLIPFFIDAAIHRQILQIHLIDVVSGLMYLRGTVLWDTPIWFLPCLLITEMAYYWLRRWTYGKDIFLVLSLVILSTVGYAFARWAYFRLPLGMDVAILAIGFYGIGNLLKGREINKLPTGWKAYALILFAFSLGILITGLQQSHTDLYKLQLDPPWLFYTGALIGIATWLMVSMLWSRSRFWAYLGRNSLPILVSHIFILWSLEKISYGLLHYAPEASDGSGLILTPILVFSVLPVAYLLNRFFPHLVGKWPTRSIPNQAGKNP